MLHDRKVMRDKKVSKIEFFLQIHQQIQNLTLNRDIQR